MRAGRDCTRQRVQQDTIGRHPCGVDVVGTDRAAAGTGVNLFHVRLSNHDSNRFKNMVMFNTSNMSNLAEIVERFSLTQCKKVVGGDNISCP